METIKILLESPLFLLASFAVFVTGLIFSIKKGKGLALKAFSAFWIIVLIQVVISAIQYYSVDLDGIGYPEDFLMPLGTMLSVLAYSCSLTLIGTLAFAIIKFNKKDLWIEVILIVISAISILVSTSVIHLFLNMMKP